MVNVNDLIHKCIYLFCPYSVWRIYITVELTYKSDVATSIGHYQCLQIHLASVRMTAWSVISLMLKVIQGSHCIALGQDAYWIAPAFLTLASWCLVVKLRLTFHTRNPDTKVKKTRCIQARNERRLSIMWSWFCGHHYTDITHAV